MAGIEFDHYFQNFGIDAFAGFVGADVFLAEDPVYADDVSGKFTVTLSLCNGESELANFQADDIGFINVEARAEGMPMELTRFSHWTTISFLNLPFDVDFPDGSYVGPQGKKPTERFSGERQWLAFRNGRRAKSILRR